MDKALILCRYAAKLSKGYERHKSLSNALQHWHQLDIEHMQTYFSFEFTGYGSGCLIDDGLHHFLHAFRRGFQYGAVSNALCLASCIGCLHHVLARVGRLCCTTKKQPEYTPQFIKDCLLTSLDDQLVRVTLGKQTMLG